MQKSILFLASVCCIAVVSFVLSSCKDDEPFVKPRLSMAKSTESVSEGAGTLEVQVKLDKAFSSDITVEYALAGTATRGSTAGSDYDVVGTLGEVDIPSGQTTGTISLSISPDAVFEGNETIEIRIKDVDSDQIDITDDDKIVVTITDDDTRAKLSFATATITSNEADRNIVVELTLDQALPSDVIVTYALSGTATDNIAGEASDEDNIFSDYEIEGSTSTKQFTIVAGQTTATLKVVAYSDFYLEDDETAIITLQSAGDMVEFGTIGECTVTLNQEDGKAIILSWDEDYTTVDMDLFLWIGDVGTLPDALDFAALSAFANFEVPEYLIIPSVVANAAFGVSYTYYEGDEDPMEFNVDFADFADGAFEDIGDSERYSATYTLANINAWDKTGGTAPAIVQTFQIVNSVYSVPSAISVPGSGSRIGYPDFSPTPTRQGKIMFTPKGLKSFAAKIK